MSLYIFKDKRKNRAYGSTSILWINLLYPCMKDIKNWIKTYNYLTTKSGIVK